MAALGVIETKGYAALVEAIDVIHKVGKDHVTLADVVKLGGGLVAAVVVGEPEDVREALKAAESRALRLSEVVRVHVIDAPHELTGKLAHV